MLPGGAPPAPTSPRCTSCPNSACLTIATQTAGRAAGGRGVFLRVRGANALRVHGNRARGRCGARAVSVAFLVSSGSGVVASQYSDFSNSDARAVASGYCPHSRVAACGSTPPATPCWRAWPRAPPQRSQRRDRRCRRRAAAAVAAASSASSALSPCCCSARGARAARKRAPEGAAARQAHRRSSHRAAALRAALALPPLAPPRNTGACGARLRARLHILCAVRDSAVWRCAPYPESRTRAP